MFNRCKGGHGWSRTRHGWSHTVKEYERIVGLSQTVFPNHNCDWMLRPETDILLDKCPAAFHRSGGISSKKYLISKDTDPIKGKLYLFSLYISSLNIYPRSSGCAYLCS
ncbi:hypothetical protein AVEN_258566-1 [Araneus ventricosus]|uniref:Uncharacterized protein n=1 Tax=Araneus ventricosus TaxID=182803 RepID=A0A4Y2TGS5_ARAVE|nr:hypothetical protein AVEN_258566-1 [Araneus ventricosus]